MTKIKVKYTKLGRQLAYGQYHQHLNLIELDSRLIGKKHLSTLVHELFHAQNPDWSENMVIQKSLEFTDILWSQKYRRIDDRIKQKN